MPMIAIQQLRRRLVAVGGRAASGGLEHAARRQDDATIRPARLVEPPLRHIDPGPATPLDGPLAFLDGVQRTELVGYAGTEPILMARIAAGVRRRVTRVAHGAVTRERHLLVGRPAALAAIGPLPEGLEPLATGEHEPPHPIGDLDRARAAVDAARTALEIAVAREFRERHDDWLVADGTLTVSPEWAADPRMLGVVKSHATLPFAGAELECYLTLPAGRRTSAFDPATRQVAPVHSWGLRLWPWQGRDLFHGLVRIETACSDAALEGADRVARWLLAERAPLSNDPRQDRLLYGIHDVERWLRARSA